MTFHPACPACPFPLPPCPRLQAYNCLDRHVKEGRGDEVCFYWEGNDVGQETVTTYGQLLDQVCQVG